MGKSYWKNWEKSVSESEFDDDDKSKCVDEMFAEFILSIELDSYSESWAFELEARVGAAARRELMMSEASLLVSILSAQNVSK